MPRFEMPDIPMKPEIELRRLREEVEYLKKEAARTSSRKPAAKPRKRSSTRTTSVKQTAMTVKRPVKKLPPLGAKQTEQPRDRLGRFARKTGAFLLSTAKSTVKGVQKAHRTYKSIKRAAKRNGTKDGLVKRKRVRRSRRKR